MVKEVEMSHNWFGSVFIVISLAETITQSAARFADDLAILLFHYYVILSYKVKIRRKIRRHNTQQGEYRRIK